MKTANYGFVVFRGRTKGYVLTYPQLRKSTKGYHHPQWRKLLSEVEQQLARKKKFRTLKKLLKYRGEEIPPKRRSKAKSSKPVSKADAKENLPLSCNDPLAYILWTDGKAEVYQTLQEFRQVFSLSLGYRFGLIFTPLALDAATAMDITDYLEFEKEKPKESKTLVLTHKTKKMLLENV